MLVVVLVTVLVAALPPLPTGSGYWKAPTVFPPSVRATCWSGCTYSSMGVSENASALPGSTPLPIAGEPAVRW